MLSLIFLLLNAIIGLLVFYNFYYKRRKLPPGPVPVPLLGNISAIKNDGPETCFLRWARQYGQVFTFWMGEQPVVCLTNYAQIMETFQKDGETYAGRFVFEEWDTMKKGGLYGIIFTEGDLWREHRRFALHILREFGLGKNLMQEKILSEVELMFQRINKEIAAGHEVNIGQILDVNVGSIINNVLFGYRLDDDKLDEFWKLKQVLKELLQNSFHPLQVVFQHNPHFFRRLPYFGPIIEKMVEREHRFNDHFGQLIQAVQEQLASEVSEGPPSNFVEAFLREKGRKDASGEKHGFSTEQLKFVCSDLWIAGQETTSTTLSWGINYLINSPKVQAKMQAELDRVIGNMEVVITTTSRPDLPYTNAVINEIQRMANLVPLNLIHKLTRDVVIDGHFLAKGTAITPQLSAVMADGKYFENPAEFRPERFLDENGRLKRVDELIPFSVGKRQCLGESLARMELFLFLANLLNQYEFLPGSEGMPSQERRLGATVQCPEFTCQMRKRK